MRKENGLCVDHKKPLYSGHGCKQWLSSMWSWRMTQRTEFSYEKVSWQPKDCQMEEFEGSKFLKRLYSYAMLALNGYLCISGIPFWLLYLPIRSTSFFEGYVNQQTTLPLFFRQYERALENWFEREIEADFSDCDLCSFSVLLLLTNAPCFSFYRSPYMLL